MDLVLWIGLGFFAVAFITSGVRMAKFQDGLSEYLTQNHQEEWRQIYEEKGIRKAFLWPLMTGTAVDFLLKSREGFGDPAIGIMRTKISHAFAAAAASMLGALVWGLLVGIILPMFGIR